VSIALFCEVLGNFDAPRAKRLDQRIRAETGQGIEAVYVLVWPNYPPESPSPQSNRAALDAWRQESGLPVWGWLNAGPDQAADAAKITELRASHGLQHWLLDIEGKWVNGTKLDVLLGAATSGGRAIASLAGFSPSGVNPDYRGFELHGVDVDWQAYFDSGEGPDPASAVRELYQSSFVIPGWDYRHRLGPKYGWGKVTGVEGDARAQFDSYLRPSAPDGTFAVTRRDWGFNVAGRDLVRAGKNVGLLMGRAAYAKTRVTLDVTSRGPGGTEITPREPDEWISIAASARIPNASKRPVSVYLAERTSDDVIVAIAKGAA